jgi:hypothetical protein
MTREMCGLPHQTELTDAEKEGIPHVLITYEVGLSNSCAGVVYVELWDAGNAIDEPFLYDMSFRTSNCDNWGMVTTARAIQVVVEKHFQLDLHKQFLMVGEDERE